MPDCACCGKQIPDDADKVGRVQVCPACLEEAAHKLLDDLQRQDLLDHLRAWNLLPELQARLEEESGEGEA